MKSLISRYLVHNLTLIILFSQSPPLYHFVLRLSHSLSSPAHIQYSMCVCVCVQHYVLFDSFSAQLSLKAECRRIEVWCKLFLAASQK